MKKKVFQVSTEIPLVDAVDIAKKEADKYGLILTYCTNEKDLPSRGFFDLYYYFILMDSEAFMQRENHQ